MTKCIGQLNKRTGQKKRAKRGREQDMESVQYNKIYEETRKK